MEAEGGERDRNVEKNVLVMKCNKNANIPYCGECLSVKTGECGFADVVAKGKNVARTLLFKGWDD